MKNIIYHDYNEPKDGKKVINTFGSCVYDIRLEEIQKTRRNYNLTVSFLVLDELSPIKYSRLYKHVLIKKNGEIKYIK